MRIRVLTSQEIEDVISMADAIDVVAQAYSAFSAGKANVPRRLSLPTPGGVSLVMPAYLEPSGALAVKLVSVFRHNLQRDLPTVHALVFVIDSVTGRPLALMEGTCLTALRTGAGSGVATRLLARQDAHVFALFGAGGQAMAQCTAMIAVRHIDELRVYTPSRVSAETLTARIRKLDPSIKAWVPSSPAETVAGADVITSATTSSRAVFFPEDVPLGAHINGVGSFTPDMREIPVSGYAAPLRLFVDSRSAAEAEAGEVISGIEEGVLQPESISEIGNVILGNVPGRTSRDEITLFKSVGLGVQDAAIAQAVLERATHLGTGREVEL